MNKQKIFWENAVLDNRRNSGHPVVATFVENKIRTINQLVELKGKKVLELGAGNGFFSVCLSRLCNLLATDYSDKMIKLNPVKNKRVVDATDIPIEDNGYDIVFESCMLHHVEEDSKVVSEMKRVSREYVIIIEPNRNNPFMFLFCLLKREERGGLKFSIKYLVDLLKSNNLQIIDYFSHGILLPNKTPIFFLPLLNKLDKKIPFFGFYNVVICKKND